MWGIIVKFFKFGLVGFSGLIIDFSITYLLKEKAKIHKYVANSIGFAAAATNNYILNRIWTFASRDPEVMTQYFKFVTVSITGLILNNFVIWLLSDKVFKLNFYIAKGIAVMVVFIWNFTMNYLFTFAE